MNTILNEVKVLLSFYFTILLFTELSHRYLSLW